VAGGAWVPGDRGGVRPGEPVLRAAAVVRRVDAAVDLGGPDRHGGRRRQPVPNRGQLHADAERSERVDVCLITQSNGGTVLSG
jgi:hypothetical protein